jgi:hypothetical protein
MWDPCVKFHKPLILLEFCWNLMVLQSKINFTSIIVLYNRMQNLKKINFSPWTFNIFLDCLSLKANSVPAYLFMYQSVFFHMVPTCVNLHWKFCKNAPSSQEGGGGEVYNTITIILFLRSSLHTFIQVIFLQFACYF